MRTAERSIPKPRPVIVAEQRASNAERNAERQIKAAAEISARDRVDVVRLAADLADMREDRDHWRTQAERLAAALDRLKAPAPVIVQAKSETEPGNRHVDSDVLYGVPAIAEAFRWRTRQVYHLADKHGLPTFKVGRIVCARRGAVAAWLTSHQQVVPQGGH